MKRNVKRTLIGTTALAVAAGTSALALTAASAETPEPAAPQQTTQSDPPLALAAPSGEYDTGTTQLHLVDEDRADVWVPEERRELMASLWYPTEDEGETAPYMTPEESEQFMAQILENNPGLELPGDLLAGVGTNSVQDAEVEGDDGELPLVMLSPGYSFPRATLTGLAEELASHGYVVAAVGHTYEAPISFPDGRTAECTTCATMDKATLDSTLVPNRSEDLSFVLDEITDDSVWDGADLIDEKRIAVGGHSAGGASSHRVIAADDRFDAGFNLDGTFFGLDPDQVDEPFLMVGAEENGQPGVDDTWTDAWNRLDGWKRWISVTGTTHSSLTDLAPLTQQAVGDGPGIDGAYADRLGRTYVTAFVDLHLRGEESDLFDGPSEEWPEVVFHNP
ncbi:alpha/beta hydrolase family protein [Glycomyces buryatensis]|uniref:Alpha/beta hydrolase n=1 Tax=Glycomyces buryatensis TaxID=2570927 RepID=A0A4S8QIQ0_9ACTN|nr:alpha/beta hydrolase [Glycomyces buryatensis]THV43641.1 alpha/beta hydrolase [Glycomyces buryatensis]